MDTSYDAELPILGEIGALVRARAVHRATTRQPQPAARPHLAAKPAPPAADPPATAPVARPAHAARRRGRTGGISGSRVARRVLVVASLTFLVAASAVATRSLVDHASDPVLRTSTAATLGAGTLSDEHWQLTAYRRGGEVCHDLLAGGSLASGCEAPPPERGLVSDGMTTPQQRIVIGLTGAGVATVTVVDGPRRIRVATRAVGAGPSARVAQLPSALRWFVLSLPRSTDGDDRAVRIVPRDARGRSLGAGVRECGVARSARACQSTRVP